jgi:hypothetical protein
MLSELSAKPRTAATYWNIRPLSGPSPRLNGSYCQNFQPPIRTYSLRVGTSWTAQKKRPRDNSKLSIDGSPKPLGALRRNFGEMMNTPRRGYAPKLTASNSLQLPTNLCQEHYELGFIRKSTNRRPNPVFDGSRPSIKRH